MEAVASATALFEEVRANRAAAATLRRLARDTCTRADAIVTALEDAARPERLHLVPWSSALDARQWSGPNADGDHVEEVSALRKENENLRAALQTRDLIWKAKLTIAAAVGCDADEAHRLLVAQSQHENRKLRE